MPISQSPIFGAAVALVIGLVVGAEREQRMAADPTARQTAGIRTFALAGLLGAVGQLLGTAVLVSFGSAVALAAIVAYALDARLDRGLTTEIALLVTFGLGALAMTEPVLALSIGLATTALLAFRARLHEMVRDVLTPVELRDALIVASAAIVILPMLPDRPIDPWGVLVPFTLWRLVVLVLGIHLAAHVAERVFGPKWGAPLAGLASGFVSSSATIGAMSARAKAEPSAVPDAIASATASSVSTFVQMALVVGAVSPDLLARAAPALAASGLVAAILATWFAVRAARGPRDTARASTAHAVDLRGAIVFACAVTGVTVLASLVSGWLGAQGLLVATALAALADTHAAAASIASVEAAHQIETSTAAVGIFVCVSMNSLTKIVLALASRPPRAFGFAVTAQVLLAAGAGWAVLAAS
jgi:uncharacterized membrane protein (DUF4010 family)